MADIVSVLEPAPVSNLHFIIRMLLYAGTYIMKISFYADRSSQLWLPWLSSTLPSWRHLSSHCWNTKVGQRHFWKNTRSAKCFLTGARGALWEKTHWRPPCCCRSPDRGKIEIITFIKSSLWLDQGRIKMTLFCRPSDACLSPPPFLFPFPSFSLSSPLSRLLTYSTSSLFYHHNLHKHYHCCRHSSVL